MAMPRSLSTRAPSQATTAMAIAAMIVSPNSMDLEPTEDPAADQEDDCRDDQSYDCAQDPAADRYSHLAEQPGDDPA